MALAVETGRRTFEFEVPQAVERERCAAARDVTIHLAPRDGLATEFASERRPGRAEQARAALVESEADGLACLRLEIACGLDDQLPGRGVDIEDR